MAKAVLHGIFASGPTYKVGLGLSLMGVPFAYKHIDLREGAHKKPEFVALNRYGQVPVLEIDGMSLCQSGAILQYLAEKSGKFAGATPLERQRAREWIYWDFDRLAGNIYVPRAIARGFLKVEPPVLDYRVGLGKAALELLEGELKKSDWLVGAGPTIADIDVYGSVWYATEAKFDLSAHPGIKAWMARLEKLPGWKGPYDLLPQQDAA